MRGNKDFYYIEAGYGREWYLRRVYFEVSYFSIHFNDYRISTIIYRFKSQFQLAVI